LIEAFPVCRALVWMRQEDVGSLNSEAVARVDLSKILRLCIE
jgi:hypothetical protein